MQFAGRTILVTGASAGVGLAVVRRFYAEGAHVALLARRREPLERAARGLDPSRALVLTADVGDVAGLPGVIERVVGHFGGLDGLVNNAGAHFRGPLETRSPDEIAAMVDVNLRAPLVLTRLALPELRTRGGFVVNVASLAGKVPLDGASTYSATKFGLRAFTFAMAEELAGSGVTFSAVSPGPIETDFILDDLDEVTDLTLSQAMCTADDVAEMVFQCALDGRREREVPATGGKLATLGYLFPGLRRLVRPRLEARGRKVREALKKRGSES